MLKKVTISALAKSLKTSSWCIWNEVPSSEVSSKGGDLLRQLLPERPVQYGVPAELRDSPIWSTIVGQSDLVMKKTIELSLFIALQCSIENPTKTRPEFNQNLIKIQWKSNQNSAKIQPKFSQNLIKIHWKSNPNSAEIWPNPTKIQPKFNQNRLKIQPKFSQNLTKIWFKNPLKIHWKSNQNSAKIQAKFE